MTDGWFRGAIGALAIACLAGASGSLRAEEGGWSGEITPYLWFSGIDGDVTVGNQRADIDVGFEDLLDKTDAAGSIAARLQFRRWLFYGQIDAFDLSTEEVRPIGAGLSANGRLETDTRVWTLAGGYQFDLGGGDSKLGLLLGARELSLENRLRVGVNGLSAATESDETYMGAVAILLPEFALSERWRFDIPLSVGGGESDSNWEVWPQFQYAVGDHWAFRFGYRRLEYDVEEDNSSFDAGFHGLTLGFGFRF